MKNFRIPDRVLSPFPALYRKKKEVAELDFQLIQRDSFSICGYCMETCLKTCGQDLAKLWEEYGLKKEQLYSRLGRRDDFYGLMWKTGGEQYCYLIGIEIAAGVELPEGTIRKEIPPARYAVASVPAACSAVEAWTEYYYQVLPEAGYEPNAGHGFDFEYYRNGSPSYELWTPVTTIALA